MSPDYQFLSWWLWEYLYFILLWSSNRKYRSINRNCLGFCHETMVYSLVYMYVLLCLFFLKCYTKTKFPSFVSSHLNCYEMIFSCDVLTRMVKVQLFSSIPQTALLPPLQWTWMGPLECRVPVQFRMSAAHSDQSQHWPAGHYATDMSKLMNPGPFHIYHKYFGRYHLWTPHGNIH